MLKTVKLDMTVEFDKIERILYNIIFQNLKKMLDSSQTNCKSQRMKWSFDTDRQLTELVRLNGPKKWDSIGRCVENRTGKQCRERWVNQLNPMLKQGPWSVEESFLVFILQTEDNYNNQWSEMSKMITCRTDGQIKNLWRQHLQHKQGKLKEMLNEGIKKHIQSTDLKSLH